MGDSSPSPTGPTLSQYSELAESAGSFIHEIKNRLASLSLNLQLLEEDFEDPQTHKERRAAERVRRLKKECDRLLGLSNDFLRFARVSALNLKPTSLEEIVGRMIEFLLPTARSRNIELTWYSSGNLPPVNLDRDLFEQALLNLMLNAEQAMPEGGTLTLIGRVEAGQVCLDVIDTGQGMSPDLLSKIFKPFHTTKPNGNGLGLPTARKIVQAHGGRIEVQSDLGRGTKFTIFLPSGVTTSMQSGDQESVDSSPVESELCHSGS